VLPDDPPDPEILAREKARLISAIAGSAEEVGASRIPSIYPRLAYRDEMAAATTATSRSFGVREPVRTVAAAYHGQV
jgi:hypothetical protein